MMGSLRVAGWAAGAWQAVAFVIAGCGKCSITLPLSHPRAGQGAPPPAPRRTPVIPSINYGEVHRVCARVWPAQGCKLDCPCRHVVEAARPPDQSATDSA